GTVRAKGVKPQTVHGAPPPETTTTTTTLALSTTTTTSGSVTTTTTVPGRTCDQSDRDQLEAGTQTGAPPQPTCARRIQLDHTLVIDGANATLRGFVTIGRGAPPAAPPPAFRLFNVRAGTLVLDGVTLSDGLELGAD